MNNEKIGMPVIPPDRSDDLHNLVSAPEAGLVLFMAGNQFMVMDELLEAFREQHPQVGEVYFETLPPGLELKQILAGGALFRDEVIDAAPDVYAAVSKTAMEKLEQAGRIASGEYDIYLHNRIVLMVPAGNPAGIGTVADLGRGDVRISQPNPENEDIGEHILNMYRASGGDGLVKRVMEEKLAAGTTMLTTVHHRETPELITNGGADVGPVWATEVVHALRQGLAVEMVDPGARLDQRGEINYYICQPSGGVNAANGRAFIDFILTEQAQLLYESYGFVRLIT